MRVRHAARSWVTDTGEREGGWMTAGPAGIELGGGGSVGRGKTERFKNIMLCSTRVTSANGRRRRTNTVVRKLIILQVMSHEIRG